MVFIKLVSCVNELSKLDSKNKSKNFKMAKIASKPVDFIGILANPHLYFHVQMYPWSHSNAPDLIMK